MNNPGRGQNGPVCPQDGIDAQKGIELCSQKIYEMRMEYTDTDFVAESWIWWNKSNE